MSGVRLPGPSRGAAGAWAPAGRLRITNFNEGGWRTAFGDPFGGWDHDPGDRTQYCRVRLVDQPRIGGQGYSLQLEYDVDSPNPAFNGFWLKLPSVHLRDYAALSLYIQGDPDRGYTDRVKVELKDARHVADYLLTGIQGTWTHMHIPLSAFRDIEKVREAKEFVIVFDDHTVTQKTGTLYLDDIAFEPAP